MSALAQHVANRLEGVDGWLSLNEAKALHDAACSVSHLRPDATIVEIGSWMGRSTIALALGTSGHGMVYAIDPHADGSEHTRFGVDDTYSTFLANLSTAGVREKVEPIRLLSHEARPRFTGDSIDLLFIDGSHEYWDVRQDIDDWTGALRLGATVAFNDPFLPGVAEALNEQVLKWRSPFRRPRLVDNTLFVEFRPNSRWTAHDSMSLLRTRLYSAIRQLWLNRLKPRTPQVLVDTVRRISVRS